MDWFRRASTRVRGTWQFVLKQKGAVLFLGSVGSAVRLIFFAEQSVCPRMKPMASKDHLFFFLSAALSRKPYFACRMSASSRKVCSVFVFLLYQNWLPSRV